MPSQRAEDARVSTSSLDPWSAHVRPEVSEPQTRHHLGLPASMITKRDGGIAMASRGSPVEEFVRPINATKKKVRKFGYVGILVAAHGTSGSRYCANDDARLLAIRDLVVFHALDLEAESRKQDDKLVVGNDLHEL